MWISRPHAPQNRADSPAKALPEGQQKREAH